MCRMEEGMRTFCDFLANVKMGKLRQRLLYNLGQAMADFRS